MFLVYSFVIFRKGTIKLFILYFFTIFVVWNFVFNLKVKII